MTDVAVDCDSSLYRRHRPFVAVALFVYTIGVLGMYSYLLIKVGLSFT